MACKVITAALAGLAIGLAALGSAAPAQAGGGWKPIPMKPFPYKPYPKPFPKPYPKPSDGCGGGLIAAGVIGGLALGAIAASAYDEGECYTLRRRVIAEDGDVLIRRVQVCE